MKTLVRRWRGGLIVRIPHSLAFAAGLTDGSVVEVSLVDGLLITRPVNTSTRGLRRLLARITPNNLHREIESGPPRGREVW
jgi:antitoxin MazE